MSTVSQIGKLAAMKQRHMRDIKGIGQVYVWSLYPRRSWRVDAFHTRALECGGHDEGAPGPRHYHPDYYGAYVRDLDRNKPNVSVSLETAINN